MYLCLLQSAKFVKLEVFFNQHFNSLKALGEARFVSQNAGNALAAGALPRTPLGELTVLPQTP